MEIPRDEERSDNGPVHDLRLGVRQSKPCYSNSSCALSLSSRSQKSSLLVIASVVETRNQKWLARWQSVSAALYLTVEIRVTGISDKKPNTARLIWGVE